MMKKVYEAPEMECISFISEEDIMNGIIGGHTSTEGNIFYSIE